MSPTPAWWRRWLQALRFVVLGVGIPTLVYWALSEQALDWRRGLSVWLASGVVLSAAGFGLYALRFRTVMQIAGVGLTVGEALRIGLLSIFYQFFVPLSVGGDIAKFVALKLRAHGSVSIAAGIVFDHVVGLAALVALSASLFVWRRPLTLDWQAWLGAALVLTLMVLVGLGIVLARSRSAGGRRAAIQALPRLLARHRVRALAAFGLSLVMQLLFALAVFLGARPFGIDVAFVDLLFVQATALMFQAVPLTLAGVGVADLAGTALYVALGLPLPAAVLLVSLLYLYRLIAAVAGGLWDLLAARR